MTNKFTEEQYQEIIKAWGNEAGYVKGIQAVVDYLSSLEMSFMVDEAVALANPRTRLGAHEQFVEKEKKYYWTTKKKNGQGKSMNLFHGAGGIVQMIGPKQLLTESEIREWGYNPEMFDKEEV